MSSVEVRYRENYDSIARDHVRYWRETGRNPFQTPEALAANEEETVRLIRKHAPKGSMLDAGCGMGDLLALFPERQRLGVDISSDYLTVAYERGLETLLCPVEAMPFADEVFDLVVACDVLEHVLDLNAAVRELLRVLTKTGVLIVRTPNDEPLSTSDEPYEFVHLRRFDAPALYILFHKIFGCEHVKTVEAGNIIHAVVRK